MNNLTNGPCTTPSPTFAATPDAPGPFLGKTELDILLPIASATMLVLAFYPFNLWPLGFVALVPIFYLAYTRTKNTELFWSGFLMGFLFLLSTSYVSLFDFSWIPDAHLFQTIMRAIPFPAAMIGGAMTGVCMVLFRKFFAPTVLRLFFLAPALLALIEIGNDFLFKGYNLFILAHVARTLPFMTSLAAIGGVHFVSFVVASCNAFIAAVLYTLLQHEPVFFRQKAVGLLPLSLYTASLLAAAGIGVHLYDHHLHAGRAQTEIAVALIQANPKKEALAGTLNKDGAFHAPALEKLLSSAEASSPDLLVYPFGPATPILSASTSSPNSSLPTIPIQSLAAWTPLHGTHTTLATWDIVERDGLLYDEVDFWKPEQAYVYHAKESEFPFIDYTPLWVQRLGFYTTTFDTAPGTNRSPILIRGIKVGTVVCSEINEQREVRRNALEASMLLSVGLNATFATGMMDQFTMTNAQFRAAENNVAVVRSNILGPSAIIDQRGAMIAELDSNETGILSRKIPLEQHPRRTLYQTFGNWPLIAFTLSLLFF